MTRHADKPYQRVCFRGHRYMTDAPGARAANRKGNPRYVCPTCRAAGEPLPKGWRILP